MRWTLFVVLTFVMGAVAIARPMGQWTGIPVLGLGLAAMLIRPNREGS